MVLFVSSFDDGGILCQDRGTSAIFLLRNLCSFRDVLEGYWTEPTTPVSGSRNRTKKGRTNRDLLLILRENKIFKRVFFASTMISLLFLLRKQQDLKLDCHLFKKGT